MILEVRVFGGLEKLITGASLGMPLQAEAPPGTTVGALILMLNIPAEQVFTVLVNGVRAGRGDALKPGDRVAFFPPVGGG